MSCLDKCNQGFHRFIVSVNWRREWNTVRCICHPSVKEKKAKGYSRESIKRFPDFVEFEGVGVTDYMKQH